MDNNSTFVDREAQRLPDYGETRGGWITFLFIAGTVTGLTLAAGGWLSNLIVYLVIEFNIKSIDAAQISNMVNGCTNLFPVIGAIVADSFLGSFSVIFVSSCISLAGIILLILTSSIEYLRPPPCEMGSSLCDGPTRLQFSILYTGLALASLGYGGTRLTVATLGANQFDKPQDQVIFFNWFFFATYTSSVISSTATVYIEERMSWTLGFGLCIAANVIGFTVFVSGLPFYRLDKPQGSPFTGLARVVVASFRKRKTTLSSRGEDYFYEHDIAGVSNMVATAEPIQNFRFLNRAALIVEGDVGIDGTIIRPWRLCSIQQVEDLKTLIKIFPLWSTSILLGTPLAIQSSVIILQALTIDLYIGKNFRIPAGSIPVIVMISTSISLTLIDRLIFPLWYKLTNRFPTPLQRIGVGHVLTMISMAVAALVERKRLKIAHAHHIQDQPGSLVPMLALWLFPQLILTGIGEAFYMPAQVLLCYQEFPGSLKSTATAMIALIIGISFYLSTALIDLFEKVTNWLPHNINSGRLDNVYWTLLVIAVVNFGYFLVCSTLYKYQNLENNDGGTESTDN